MLKIMSRDPLRSVTLPILISAPSEAAEGAWGFYPQKGGESLKNVRVISPEEVTQKLREILRGKDWELFKALDGLARAYARSDGRRDGLEMLDALDRVRPFIREHPGTTMQVDWTGPKMWDAARWEYSQQMSTCLQGARLVMWCEGKGKGPICPGVYCPDLKTAAFVMRYVGGIRVCPQCERPFVPKKETQVCCTAAHGVRFRTARSRRNAKLREEKRRVKARR